MGFISRKLFPACETMCVCCPALRSRSRQPVKRYKTLIAEIFPKSPDGQPNDRKLAKLCEYASKNPIRIPKITKLLEERFYKELRSGHLKIVNIVIEAYNKLLCMCVKQMAYFAASLLSLTDELLDNSKQVAVQIAGCQTLTRFIYSQTDGTYAHNIGSFVKKVCTAAGQTREERECRPLRASCLQCLSAMVWYMTEFSHIFDDINEVVHVILSNYEENVDNMEQRTPKRHQWVDEVVRSDGRDGAGGPDTSACSTAVRPPPERKNVLSLVREEIENPRVWAQICLQRMAELGKESTTMRRVLEPMFVYFDTGRQWSPQQGLAAIVLCDMSYFMEVPEYQTRVLNGVVRHIDHKNVSHDPAVKQSVIQVAATLARQIRSGATLNNVGCVSDLLRHLRKSLQATASPIGEEESYLNVHLQNSIESCLLEIAKGIKDATSLLDLMGIALEKLPPVGVVAQATVGSVLILSHVLVSVFTNLQQGFPEALLVQLLKAMLHSDAETRIGAHQIFSVLLFPSFCRSSEAISFPSSATSTYTSVRDLLEKLRKEKDSSGAEKHRLGGLEDCKGRAFPEDDCKQAWSRKNSPNFYKLSSIIDSTAGINSSFQESYAMKLSEDQIMQLLSCFWIQSNFSDNLPSNYEAIAHSYCLTLTASQIKSANHGLAVRFFQLPLSLRSIALCSSYGMLPPACRRSLFITSTTMLMYAARVYQIPELIDMLKCRVSDDVDTFLGINEDLHVYVKPQANLRQYGSAADNQAAISFLSEVQDMSFEFDKAVLELIVRHLCCMIKIEEEELFSQLSATFSPDEAIMFAPKALRELDHIQRFGCLKETSHDGDLSVSSAVEDDVTSAFSALNISGQNVDSSPSNAHIMSIGQLLESALEVAGQVVGTSISTSPLPYSAMTGQCEALETGSRKKLSNWLAHESATGNMPPLPSDGHAGFNKGTCHVDRLLEEAAPQDQYCPLKLPPASPFDNFLRAVSGPNPISASGVSA